MITWASRQLLGRKALLRLSGATWASLLTELQRRGQGRRESGAFLLGTVDGQHPVVTEVVYFDELDADALTGSISLRAPAFSRLWDICRQHELRVIGDVHTHPSRWVCQSDIDRANPMIARDGHVALIIPNFAQDNPPQGSIGVHRYLGEEGWISWCAGDGGARLYVGRWP